MPRSKRTDGQIPINRDVAEVRILTIRFTGWATGCGLKDERTPPAIRLTLVLLNLRAEISIIDERIPTLLIRCCCRSPQLKVDVPVDVSGQHDVDAWSGRSFEGRFAESQTKVKELADVVVHGSVMDVEAARPTSAQQDRACRGVPLIVSPLSVVGGQVCRRGVQPNDNAAVPVGFGKLLMRPLDAVQYRFKPGDLAVRVELVGWVERHRLRRPAQDIVSHVQMPQLLGQRRQESRNSNSPRGRSS